MRPPLDIRISFLGLYFFLLILLILYNQCVYRDSLKKPVSFKDYNKIKMKSNLAILSSDQKSIDFIKKINYQAHLIYMLIVQGILR